LAGDDPLRLTPEDDGRRRRLRRMQAVATGLLVAVAAGWAIARALEDRLPWLAPLRAFCEAAMVGGIADWFAVTALFRHPLGIPIPHTAIIPARKARIGAALGGFVQRHFLTREVVADKVRAMQLGRRMATWLTDPANSHRVTQVAARGVSGAATLLRDEDVEQMVDHTVIDRLRRVEAAPLVATGFTLLTADRRHHALLDEVLRMAARFVAENEALIREQIRERSPWWVPGAVESRLGDRILAGVEATLAAVAADPSHPLRARYDDAVDRFVTRLREDPGTMARAEDVKQALLDHPAVGAFIRERWQVLRERLAGWAEGAASQGTTPVGDAPADPLDDWLVAFGHRLLADSVMLERIDGVAVDLVTSAVDQARDEVAVLIASTVAAWDADATSRKIELQIGRDLQFIRINGTLVGGLVGLALHVLRP
jgi:uncharacterized membrane-anchored protein YjiN (DUF445 family)